MSVVPYYYWVKYTLQLINTKKKKKTAYNQNPQPQNILTSVRIGKEQELAKRVLIGKIQRDLMQDAIE